MIVMAALLSFSAAAAPGVDIVANETPIHTVKNAEAVAKIPAGFKFVEPGTLTVAISCWAAARRSASMPATIKR